MIMARILGKDRLWRLKFLRRNMEGVFRLKSFEYEIHGDCVYMYRLLGFKLVRCIDYVEGVRKPIKYDGIRVDVTLNEIPLDEISMVISRALKNIFIMLTLLFSAGAFLMALIAVLKLFDMIV